MKTRPYIAGLVVLSIVVLVVVAVISLRTDVKGQRKAPELPPLISKVASLEIVTSRMEDEGRAGTVVLELRNNSDKSIIAMDFEAGNKRDSSGVVISGIYDGDVKPMVLAKPGETFVETIALTNFLQGFPLNVSAVMYEDGTTEGEKASVNRLQRSAKERRTKPTKGGRL